ncbi:MAG: hypothetical protein HYR76_10440 [Ignavibacteria bacterium]|nr:hypothetical protein [Ignavibacteria bacterium]MBI3765571.1 hypothetical protein [Ignavibacteriales bacterium]
MKPQAIVFALAVAMLAWSGNKESIDYSQTVNSILGDISFIKKFGHLPDASTNENLRIRNHLEYVENLLRHRDCSNLTNELQQRRHQLLDMLHQYWTSNVFPRNYDYSDQRVPCFIDKDGRICAVGYLIERSVGRSAAERVNSKYKYEKILAMNDDAVRSWIATTGLSTEECAWIQPTYGYVNPKDYNYITPAYGISSSILGATNLSLSTVNVIQMVQGSKKKAVPIIGLVTGAGQIMLGASMMPEETRVNGYPTNESQKVLSIVNIGLGITTMILSTWNLVATPEYDDKNIGWNIHGFPTPNGNVGLAFSLSRRF